MAKKLRVMIASALLVLLVVSYLIYRGAKKTEAVATPTAQPKSGKYHQVHFQHRAHETQEVKGVFWL